MEGFVWLPLKEYKEMKADIRVLIEHADWLGLHLAEKQVAMDTADDYPSEVWEMTDRVKRVQDLKVKYL